MEASNFIHPTAIIGPNCEIVGTGNHIGPYCVLDNCVIGSDNHFESHVSIGSWPEMKPRTEPLGRVIIMDNCEFREFVTVNSGKDSNTIVHSGVLMLRGSHCGHDAVIDEKAVISCNVMIGGHSYVGTCANLGLGTVVHQRRAIGALAMVGMGSIVTRNIPPGALAYGAPCKVHGTNKVGMDRFGIVDLTPFKVSYMQAVERMGES